MLQTVIPVHFCNTFNLVYINPICFERLTPITGYLWLMITAAAAAAGLLGQRLSDHPTSWCRHSCHDRSKSRSLGSIIRSNIGPWSEINIGSDLWSHITDLRSLLQQATAALALLLWCWQCSSSTCGVHAAAWCWWQVCAAGFWGGFEP